MACSRVGNRLPCNRMIRLLAVCLTAPPSSALSAEQPDYARLARTHSEEMISRGTERWGRENSPQFASQLLRNHPPELLPDAVFGTAGRGAGRMQVANIRHLCKGSNRAPKTTHRGGDAAASAALCQLPYAITHDTGGPCFANTADAALSWFLANAPFHDGLLPREEHTRRSVRRERADHEYAFDSKHDFDSFSREADGYVRPIQPGELGRRVAAATQPRSVPGRSAQALRVLLPTPERSKWARARSNPGTARDRSREAIDLPLQGESPLPRSIACQAASAEACIYPEFHSSHLGGDDLRWGLSRASKASELLVKAHSNNGRLSQTRTADLRSIFGGLDSARSSRSGQSLMSHTLALREIV